MSGQHFRYIKHFWELPLGKEIGLGSRNWADSAYFQKIQLGSIWWLPWSPIQKFRCGAVWWSPIFGDRGIHQIEASWIFRKWAQRPSAKSTDFYLNGFSSREVSNFGFFGGNASSRSLKVHTLL